jgi:hypothetical protein
MKMDSSRNNILYVFFLLMLVCNVMLWVYSHRQYARWANVPPVPDKSGIVSFALGDRQLAYRSTGLMLQNLGNTGADNEPFQNYDYGRIGKWLELGDRLDSRSDHLPFLAAFYFGATQNPAQLPPIVDFLAKAGRRDDGAGEKWRWLAQAVYLARWREHDMGLALQLAQELAEKWHPGRPLWIKQMPAFVMTAAGDKKTAYGLMLRILKEEQGKVQQAELNNTMIFICQRILDKEEAVNNELCKTLPPELK